MASAGLLSLKWNNHKTTFFHVLSTIRTKEAYCDVTIACDGRFYPVHKFVMSTCSDYFKEMFERTDCKHPVIVLKDIRHEDLEALLNYMYVGEVNVLQNELAGLIKAAECLMIKGLAVPDESPTKESPKETKRETKEGSPQAKRRRYDSDNDNNSSEQKQSARHSSSASEQSPSSRRKPASSNLSSDNLSDDHRPSQVSRKNSDYQTNPESSRSQNTPSNTSQRTETVVVLDEPSEVKEEPEEIQEVEEVLEDTKNVIESSFAYEHLSEGDSMSNFGDGGTQDAQSFDGQQMSGGPQTMEDLVAQAIPGSSGMDMSSLWESEGSLQGFPPEAQFGDPQGPPQMGVNLVTLSSCRLSERDKRDPGVAKRIIHSSVSYPSAQHSSVEPLHREQESQEKCVQCSICGYNALSESKLAIHFRKHTGEKPFACPYCNHRCSHRSNLSTHIKTRHSDATNASKSDSSTPVKILPHLKTFAESESGRIFFHDYPE